MKLCNIFRGLDSAYHYGTPTHVEGETEYYSSISFVTFEFLFIFWIFDNEIQVFFMGQRKLVSLQNVLSQKKDRMEEDMMVIFLFSLKISIFLFIFSSEEVLQIQKIMRNIPKNLFYFHCSTLLSSEGCRLDTRMIALDKVFLHYS